ncbi:hypothetical protein TrCOL_g12763 [Triparma columacea]|nr:hypothetical protein TrCOL_g12763 [Triparma columacea]
MKVAVLGAGGGIGQPLSLLLKLSPHVSNLALYDIRGTPGVSSDLSHIPSPGTVTGHLPGTLPECLAGSDVVVIPAGVPRKPGMSRDDLFGINAAIVKGLVEAVASHCPGAVICVISNPVNSLVPVCKEVLVRRGCYNPSKLCGVTYLDVCRANTFVGEAVGANVSVNVVGGHSGTTIVPLLSQTPDVSSLSQSKIDALVERIRNGGDEVVSAKDGAGSATLSMAHAGFVFVENVVKALGGEEDVVMPAYTECDVVKGCSFFAVPCRFGKSGVEEVMGLGKISEGEKGMIDDMSGTLASQIEKGRKWAIEASAKEGGQGSGKI